MKILVYAIKNRKAYDVYNVLKNKYKLGKNLILATDKFNLFLYLIYGKFYRLRESDFEKFEQDLLKISSDFQGEDIVFIPQEERYVELFYRFVEKHGSLNFKFLLPPNSSFEIARDKERTYKFCEKIGVSVPKTFYCKDLSLLERELPLIGKPKKGEGAKDFIYIEKKDDIEKLRGIDLQKYIIQKKLSNSHEVAGGFFLCMEGKVILFYSHKRIRTFPPKGGVTTYSKFTMNYKIKELGEKVLKELNWSGLVMIEFLYDDVDKEYKLIEINPRLWGSILLSEFSGACLLKNYINLSLRRPLEKNKVRENTYIKWFFPGEILYFLRSGNKKSLFREIFLKHNFKKTCYINITYSNIMRTFLFFIQNILSPESIRKYIAKTKN